MATGSDYEINSLDLMTQLENYTFDFAYNLLSAYWPVGLRCLTSIFFCWQENRARSQFSIVWENQRNHFFTHSLTANKLLSSLASSFHFPKNLELFLYSFSSFWKTILSQNSESTSKRWSSEILRVELWLSCKTSIILKNRHSSPLHTD